MAAITSMSTTYIDLFSGIGGHAIALKGVAEPCCFCEIDAHPRSILERRFPGVPIFQDVRKIRGDEVREAALARDLPTPRLITASFPCQDVSSAGKGKGIFGDTRSTLVWEVLRLVDEMPEVQTVLLENSPMLAIRGLDEIAKAFRERGFSLRWGVLGARHLGARHNRRRIWVLALKAPSEEDPIRLHMLHSTPKNVLARRALDAIEYPFKSLEADVPRLVPRPEGAKPNRALRLRWNSLGNAILPQCARLALAVLLQAAKDPSSPEDVGGISRFAMGSSKVLGVEVADALKVREVMFRSYPGMNYPWGEDAYVAVWPTPVRCSSHFSPGQWAQPGRARSKSRFATRVFHAHDTAERFRYTHGEYLEPRSRLCINIEWVEQAIMGFPQGWTEGATAPPPSEAAAKVSTCNDEVDVVEVIEGLERLEVSVSKI